MAGLTPQEAADATDDQGGFIDPAEFLLTNPTYHNCFLTVVDPETKNVMKIGAESSHLASHSSVFRKKLLKDNGGTKHIEITDVSVPVVKLMLTHMYGGKMPTMDRATRAQLALAAHAYDIRYLLDDCCQVLVPTTVDELFPALVCAAHLDNAVLLPHVEKIVQEKTDKVIKNSGFLKLDAKCMEFIASQDVLAVKELDLWKALVNWATTCAANEAKTARDVLGPVLQSVRLATLTHEQIIKEVVQTKILTDSEAIQLLTAVTLGTTLNCPGLNGNCEPRSVQGSETVNKPEKDSLVPIAASAPQPLPTVVKDKEGHQSLGFDSPVPISELRKKDFPTKLVEVSLIDKFKYCYSFHCKESHFILKPTKPVSIEYLSLSVFYQSDLGPGEFKKIQIRYKVDVIQANDDSSRKYPGDVVAGYFSYIDIQISRWTRTVKLPVYFKDDLGKSYHLREFCEYKLSLLFDAGHPMYHSCYDNFNLSLPCLTLVPDGPCHVVELGYKVPASVE